MPRYALFLHNRCRQVETVVTHATLGDKDARNVWGTQREVCDCSREGIMCHVPALLRGADRADDALPGSFPQGIARKCHESGLQARRRLLFVILLVERPRSENAHPASAPLVPPHSTMAIPTETAPTDQAAPAMRGNGLKTPHFWLRVAQVVVGGCRSAFCGKASGLQCRGACFRVCEPSKRRMRRAAGMSGAGAVSPTSPPAAASCCEDLFMLRPQLPCCHVPFAGGIRHHRLCARGGVCGLLSRRLCGERRQRRLAAC